MELSPLIRTLLLALAILSPAVTGGDGADDGDAASNEVAVDVVLVGDNVCVEQKPENKTVRVSYMESHEVKEYEWCFKVPPRCPVWKTKMSIKYKDKEISRIVNHHSCCNGYKQAGNKCEPVCRDPCLQGTCVEPDVCSCNPGFSGATCKEIGCPKGNWGKDCSEPCPCSNGGRCEPHTGACQCLPGWSGDVCQDRCDGDHFGQGCHGECECPTGHRCHHVTGDCTPCPDGFFGDKCLLECQCSSNGTALCYHENGNCFCRTNFYGRRCEMHCPFGYLDGVCHKEPMAVGFCSCSSDMYRCDKELGCVCKDGFDCEGGTHFIDFASLSAKDDGKASHAKAVSIIATVLLLALVVTVLAVLYYRRRMRRMQKDLEHRSVRYIENSVLDTSNPRTAGLMVVTDSEEPYPFELPPPTQPQPTQQQQREVEPGPSRVRPDATTNNDSSQMNNARYSNKNVNLDRFKLGAEDEEDGYTAPVEEEQGACAMPARHCYEEIDEDGEDVDGAAGGDTVAKKDPNVNVYDDGDDDAKSPSKEKNNAKLADMYSKGKSVNKPNVNLVINNTFEPDGYAVADDDHADPDDDMDPKTLMREAEARRDGDNGFDDDFA